MVRTEIICYDTFMKTIKTTITAILLIFFLGSAAYSGTTCGYNAYGQIVCESDGQTNVWNNLNNSGTWTTNDARGNTQSVCYTNAYGQFVCD